MTGGNAEAEDLVTYRRSDGIVHLMLNRPEKLNALSAGLRVKLREALERFDDDREARVAIISGSGRAFCAGADVQAKMLGEVDAGPRSPGEEPGGRSPRIHRTLLEMTNWKPVIAAVHGYAVGGGIVLALACDIVIAAEGTSFQVTEISRGISGNEIWSYIRRRTGEEFANEVTLTGRRFSAGEAHARGMISQVVPGDTLIEAANALAVQIAKNPPLAVQEAVRQRRMEFEAIEVEARRVLPRYLRFTEDYAESARAFSEKRPPKFVGR